MYCEINDCRSEHHGWYRNITLRNDSLHEIKIEMCAELSKILGLHTAFRLQASIEEEDRVHIDRDSFEESIDEEDIYVPLYTNSFEGWKPELNTILPQSYLALTSSIAQHGMIGSQMKRVLTILECPPRLNLDGIIPIHVRETNFVPAQPGVYQSVDCEVVDVFNDQLLLKDVVGDFKMDLALIIKSDEA